MTDAPDTLALEDDLRELVDLDRAKKEAAAAEKAANGAYRRKEAEVYEKFEAAYGANIKTINVDLGPGYGSMRFGRRTTIYGKIEDEHAARESLRALGLEDAMFQPKPFAKALNDFVKELIESGAELPDGVDFTERRVVSKQSA